MECRESSVVENTLTKLTSIILLSTPRDKKKWKGSMRSKWEIRADRELVEAGYSVDYKMRPSRPNPYYNTDYFNVFDLMAYKPGELRMISIKSAKNALVSHQEAIIGMDLPPGISKELWRYDKPAPSKRVRVRKWRFIGTDKTDMA